MKNSKYLLPEYVKTEINYWFKESEKIEQYFKAISLQAKEIWLIFTNFNIYIYTKNNYTFPIVTLIKPTQIRNYEVIKENNYLYLVLYSHKNTINKIALPSNMENKIKAALNKLNIKSMKTTLLPEKVDTHTKTNIPQNSISDAENQKYQTHKNNENSQHINILFIIIIFVIISTLWELILKLSTNNKR